MTEPKIPLGGAFGGVHRLIHSALPHILRVHSLPIPPSYNGVQSIEVNLQPASRERMFPAQNAPISATCRKMRFFTNNFSNIPS